MPIILHTPDRHDVTVGRRGTEVVVFYNGEPCFKIPWQMAIAVSNLMKQHGRMAESYERILDRAARESLVKDHELLVKNGVSLNLGIVRGDYERVLKDVNADKKMPVVGAPKVAQHRPTSAQAAKQAESTAKAADERIQLWTP